MNAIIQPVHLILYTVFVSSAINLVSINIIYAFVVLAFLLKAEKIIKKMFGLDGAESTGSLGSIAGGAMMMQGMQRLFGGPPPKGPMLGKGGSGGNGGSDSNKDGITFSKSTTASSDIDTSAFGSASASGGLAGGGSNGLTAGASGGLAAGGKGKNLLATAGNVGKNLLTTAGNAGKNMLGSVKNAGKNLSGISGNNGIGSGLMTAGKQTPVGNSSGSRQFTPAKGRMRSIGGFAKGKVRKLWGKKGQVARKLAVNGTKVAGKALGITAGALGGMAAGIASGDASNILKYGVTGAALGNQLGNKMAGAVDNGIETASNLIDKGRDFVDGNSFDYNKERYGYDEAVAIQEQKQFERERAKFEKDQNEIEKYQRMAHNLNYKGNYKDLMDEAAEMKRLHPEMSDDVIEGVLKSEMAMDKGQVGGQSSKTMRSVGVYASKNGLDQKDLADEKVVKAMNNKLNAKYGKDIGSKAGNTIADILGQGKEYRATTNQLNK